MEKSARGPVIITQKPNIPMVVAVLASALSVASAVLLSPVIGVFFGLIAYGSWFTWAWLEVFDGANRIRKGLGIIVIGLLLAAGMWLVLHGSGD